MISLKRLIRSFGYAGRGLAKVWHEEQNFKIEVTVALMVLLAALLLGVKIGDIAILCLTSGLVLVMEVVNSAVEAISDCLKPRLDIYVKRIKDIVAAGVMVSALVAVVVGILIFWSYL